MFTRTAFGKGKGRARYKVPVDSYGCWGARRKGGGNRSGGLPRKLSGCITITDLLRLND